jgi:hypothetical protein
VGAAGGYPAYAKDLQQFIIVCHWDLGINCHLLSFRLARLVVISIGAQQRNYTALLKEGYSKRSLTRMYNKDIPDYFEEKSF